MAVSAMLVSMSSDRISLVSRSSSVLSLGGNAGCLGDSDSIPDSVDSGGLALLGRLRLAEDVSWLGGVGENVSGTSSSLRDNFGDGRQSRLGGGSGLLRLVGGLGVLGCLGSGGLLGSWLGSRRLLRRLLGGLAGLVVTGRRHLRNIVTVGETTERVVSRQLVQGTSDLLIDFGFDSAVVLVETVEETRAVVHTKGTSVASVDDVLEELLVPASHEVSVAAVASNVTVGEDERLLALSLSPAALEFVSVPVGLVEEMRNVDPALGAVEVAVVVLGVGHVVLEVGKASLGVVTRWEVNISSERRVATVTGSVRESNALVLGDRVTDTGCGTVRLGIPRGDSVIVVGARAGHSRGVDGTLGRVEVGLSTSLGHGACHGVTSNNLKTGRERLDLIVSLLEAVGCISDMSETVMEVR